MITVQACAGMPNPSQPRKYNKSVMFATVATVIALAAIYTQEALGFSTQDSIKLILLVNVTAAAGADPADLSRKLAAAADQLVAERNVRIDRAEEIRVDRALEWSLRLEDRAPVNRRVVHQRLQRVQTVEQEVWTHLVFQRLISG
mgnify:CR=1 FL=1